MYNILELAKNYEGVYEYVGIENNPVIMGWANELNIPYSGDSVAWCALFMSYVLYKAGYVGAPKTLRARDFLDYGLPVDTPEVGDIVIFWRDSLGGNLGHVGIITGFNGESLEVISGNNNNEVNIDEFSKDKVLGYRRVSFTNKVLNKNSIVLLIVLIGLVVIVYFYYDE